jgi:hypothetical protein
MATTTNYGWTTPDDTALVKDGAAAIRTLGSSIDTSLNTALGTKKAGLVLLNTTSFSAVSSQSFNNVFSSTYDNYKILITASSATDTDLQIRLRVGGSDNSTASSYVLQRITASSTTVGGVRQTDSYWRGYSFRDNDYNSQEITLYRPFLTKPTLFSSYGNYGESNALIFGFTGSHNQSTSYDGFTMFGPTVTGTISIYGFNK